MEIAILGFGVEGKDAAKYFVGKKAEITVFDRKQKDEIETSGFAKIRWKLGGNYLSDGLVGFDLIVRSPGIRPDLPEINKAVESGAELTNTTKIFFDECKTPIIAVTGTKGKGTTSSLIAEGLKACGKKVTLLGNIGEPILASLSSTSDVDFVVLELSSFQTIDLNKSPHVVVITNITLDHMDWHTSQEEYEKAKQQLWLNQTKDDFLIINEDDPTSMRLSKNAPGNVQTYNGENDKASELIIPGKHNVYNANAALLAIKLLGCDQTKAWEGITKFPGLEHRLEKVAEVNGVTYINDSYATNPEPTLAAIAAFEQPKILILGGSSKGANFYAMAQKIAESNVRGVVLIGDEAKNIESSLVKAGFEGKMVDKQSLLSNSGKSKMEDTVQVAQELAQPGDVVLLSPACASFGLFQNYKDRGKQFKEVVKGMSS